LLYPAEL